MWYAWAPIITTLLFLKKLKGKYIEKLAKVGTIVDRKKY